MVPETKYNDADSIDPTAAYRYPQRVELVGSKDKLADYTEDEFKSLIQVIDDAETESQQAELVAHLNKIISHPAGSDLLFYPEPGANESAVGIVQTIKVWCAANGLSGFKAG